MTNPVNPQQKSSEADDKARRNRPDIAPPEWELAHHREQERKQQQQEYEARLGRTLLSAIQRGVIPDIQNLPDSEWLKGDHIRVCFLNMLENPNQQLGGARPLDTTYSDADLRRAWKNTNNALKQIYLLASRKAQQDAVNAGLLPSADSDDPDLYRRYYLRAIQIPHPPTVPELVKVWDEVKSEWEANKNNAVSTPSGDTQAQNLTTIEQRRIKLRTERELILYSLVYWATKRRTPSIQQKVACEKAGISQRTYQDKKKRPEIFLNDTQIQQMGTTFEELWSTVAAGDDIENLLETDF